LLSVTHSSCFEHHIPVEDLQLLCRHNTSLCQLELPVSGPSKTIVKLFNARNTRLRSCWIQVALFLSYMRANTPSSVFNSFERIRLVKATWLAAIRLIFNFQENQPTVDIDQTTIRVNGLDKS
jgi:hypothetical protein